MPFTIPIIGLGALYHILGTAWRRTLKQRPPPPDQWPSVSIIIPAYNSYSHIAETIRSVKNIDYPHKEIIVVNETKDRTRELCKHGIIYIETTTRLGKSRSLNMACSHASGEILFFLDSDTIAKRDVLRKLVPWFSDTTTAAVMPTYETKDTSSFLSRLISFDTAFLLSLVNMHMFFGSMIGFRGCGIAMRKSTLKEAGGWPNTLTEDNDLASRFVKAGLNIRYEPTARVKTGESETIKELKQQRIRWGKGSVYSFLRHRKFYMRNPQFLLHNFPYMILQFAIALFILYHLVFFNPLAIISAVLTAIGALIIHTGLVAWPELRRKRDVLFAIPFTLYYLPLVSGYYFKGFLSGLKNKKNRKPELIFSEW